MKLIFIEVVIASSLDDSTRSVIYACLPDDVDYVMQPYWNKLWVELYDDDDFDVEYIVTKKIIKPIIVASDEEIFTQISEIL
jgi:hypothetical protein